MTTARTIQDLPAEVLALIIEHVYASTVIGIGWVARHWPVNRTSTHIHPNLAILKVSRRIRAVALQHCPISASALWTIDQDIGAGPLLYRLNESSLPNLRRVQFLAKVRLWLWRGVPGRTDFAAKKHPRCRRKFTLDCRVTYSSAEELDGSFCSCRRDGCAEATRDAMFMMLQSLRPCVFDAKNIHKLWQAANFDVGMLQRPDTWVYDKQHGVRWNYNAYDPRPPTSLLDLKRQLLGLSISEPEI